MINEKMAEYIYLNLDVCDLEALALGVGLPLIEVENFIIDKGWSWGPFEHKLSLSEKECIYTNRHKPLSVICKEFGIQYNNARDYCKLTNLTLKDERACPVPSNIDFDKVTPEAEDYIRKNTHKKLDTLNWELGVYYWTLYDFIERSDIELREGYGAFSPERVHYIMTNRHETISYLATQLGLNKKDLDIFFEVNRLPYYESTAGFSRQTRQQIALHNHLSFEEVAKKLNVDRGKVQHLLDIINFDTRISESYLQKQAEKAKPPELIEGLSAPNADFAKNFIVKYTHTKLASCTRGLVAELNKPLPDILNLFVKYGVSFYDILSSMDLKADSAWETFVLARTREVCTDWVQKMSTEFGITNEEFIYFLWENKIELNEGV